MAEVLFYHLERSTLEQALPGLLSKTLERGGRAAVRCGTPDGLERLDEHLWTFRDESFLPHGRAGEAREAEQPVLLTLDAAGNEAGTLFVVEGGAVTPEEMTRFERTVVMFGAAEAPEARDLWRGVKAAGLDATYWKQVDGRWTKAG